MSLILKKTYSKNNNEIALIEQFNEKFDKTVLIIGVVHGDEPQGKFLIENYLNVSLPLKRDTRSTNKLLFIPCLNPDGLALGKRENSNLVDINRNFPTLNNKKDFSLEIETKFIIDIIEEFSPDIILTFHAPYKVVNYDGPAEKIAEKISQITGYPVSNDIGYPTPGSLGTYAGVEKNIPIITLELDEEIDVKDLVQPVNKIFDYLSKTA